MPQHLYKRDFFGNLVRDREAERRNARGGGPWPFRRWLVLLAMLALIMVIASSLHSSTPAAPGGCPGLSACGQDGPGGPAPTGAPPTVP